MVPAGTTLDCPSCPPSVDGGLARRRVLAPAAAHHCSARLAADPHAAATARHLAAEAVTAAGLDAVVADVEQLVEELVANAASHTQAPLELTIDAHDDVVRVEVHDQRSRVALGLEEHPAGHGGPLDPAATDRPKSVAR
jgi:signal transduction histidine kinase